MKRRCPLLASFFFLCCFSNQFVNAQANVLVGKSFVNITRPSGGTVVPGDVLEIRLSFFVYSGSSSYIYRTRYNDTIPSNLTYVSNSLKLLTNEGKQYKAYTDAAGDDPAMYNSANKTIRFNLGRDTVNSGYSFAVGNVNSTSTDTTEGGGYFNRSTHRPRAGGGTFGNGMLLIISYRVTVDISTPYNTIITYGPGNVRYRRVIGAGAGSDQLTAVPNNLMFIVYPNYGLCSNATGSNTISAGNGDFSSGTNQNGANPGAAVPGYVFGNITASFPGDGSYSVIKNLSPNQLTDPYVARPNTTSGNRVFGVWDIIGDHTNAANPVTGNPPAASGATGGYMLVVNSALQLSVANNQTISGLCEETYYEFSAWFRNVCKRCGSDSLGNNASGTSVPAGYIPTAAGDSSGVKPNLTFQINGVDYYTTGNIDYASPWGEWVKKGFVFKTAAGQTSLTISIKNNAPGGGGNDWAMDDIAFATCLPALTMRPTNTPTYCINNQVDISVAVSTYFDNYLYYQWERSTNGGTTWASAPELPGMQTFSFTNFGGEFRDTAFLPSFISTPAYDGYKYRIRVATTSSNLTSGSCAVYNAVDIITIDVNTSCDILNMQMKNEQVQLVQNKAVLQWNAFAERGSYKFTIEHSTDGRHFTAIGQLNGTAGSWQIYRFVDPNPVNGKNYYRIRMIPEAGAEKISATVTLTEKGQEEFMLTSLVNPFAEQLRFDLQSPGKEIVTIQLIDAVGKVVYAKNENVATGINRLQLNNLPVLQSGIYILRLQTSLGVINKQVKKG
ncbi:putative secreted protein (Por secretion system target) [Lacibacter cauensis]|uniref:Putative secreted protein (Por secretion system target) n=1 Tax=Lacibacter cauensis TaxID=510947 RepID=A0A562SJ24_9BACT|nr:T9SS type A sorting domain-containing protein [Lacibacter cauensis]TWI81267.1 putative secreted protein (Por secretion system target) [Lacibacter cauensis]